MPTRTYVQFLHGYRPDLTTVRAQYSYDYEIGIGDASWSTLQNAALAAAQATAAFDFSAYLL
jgi:hypothetical protein